MDLENGMITSSLAERVSCFVAGIAACNGLRFGIWYFCQTAMNPVGCCRVRQWHIIKVCDAFLMAWLQKIYEERCGMTFKKTDIVCR